MSLICSNCKKDIEKRYAKKTCDPQELINHILRIMEREVYKLMETDELNDFQIKVMPDFLRIILATQKNKVSEEKSTISEINPLSTQELELLIAQEKKKQKDMEGK